MGHSPTAHRGIGAGYSRGRHSNGSEAALRSGCERVDAGVASEWRRARSITRRAGLNAPENPLGGKGIVRGCERVTRGRHETRTSAPKSRADSRRVRSLPHDASMRPLFSAAMVIALTCCLFVLASGIARLFHRFGFAAKTATQIVFGAACGAALAGLIGIPVIIIGPSLTQPWQVVAYFGWLSALSILAAGVLVPVFFKPR
ncbi:MAG: hypothetical protein JWO52_1642 [Gammaproteobacteria bacterium]|nr:hypothetical protein [Gammaproteobacteria bacterium]